MNNIFHAFTWNIKSLTKTGTTLASRRTIVSENKMRMQRRPECRNRAPIFIFYFAILFDEGVAPGQWKS